MKSINQILTCIYILASLLAAGSVYAQSDAISATPYRGSGSGSIGLNPTRFVRLDARATGIVYQHRIESLHRDKRLYHSSFACGTPMLGDVNLDGAPDIFITGGPSPNALYLQTGNLQFADLTPTLGLGGIGLWAGGGVMVDIDNDGDLDIYVCYYDAPNHLYINQLKETGKLSFIENAAQYGLNIRDASLVPAFADYDADGDLDLYLLTHQLHRLGGRPLTPIQLGGSEEDGTMHVAGELARYYVLEDEKTDGKWMYKERGRSDYLLRNDNGKFVDVGDQVGVPKRNGIGNSATWWDFDHDGDIDLHVGNDFLDPDYLYRNKGDGTFEEVLNDVFPQATWFTMGTVITDLNNDGWTDFVVADMFPSTHYKQKASMASMGGFTEALLAAPGARQIMRNGVFVNTGTGPFREAAYLSGLGMTDWTWAIKSGDYDQDGRQDLYFTNGAARNFNFSDLPSLDHEALVGRNHWDNYEKTIGPKMEQNYAYRNTADFKFEDVSKDWGLDHVGMTHTCAQGDLDGDGDLDLVTCSLAEPTVNPNELTYIYRNDGQNGSSVRVKLVGTKSNKMGVGSEVRIKTASGEQVRQLFLAWGFMDADLAELHFGLGSDKEIQQLQVRWPSGIVQTFKDLAANQTYTITEAGDPAPETQPAAPETWFAADDALADQGHTETDFDDFVRQSLLPWKLSQFGPSMAWGDIDADGDDDLFLGGSAGFTGKLLKNETEAGGEPKFTPLDTSGLKGDETAEDMGSLFFDADGDGDLDLFVVSGSVEQEPGSELLRDRLYLNDGAGKFTKSGDAIPDLRESGSTAAAADFDRDGDLDLFVGTRSNIGAYPEAVSSRILINDGGKFEDGTEVFAPELINLGLVTGATWSDIDNDGWIDLVIARDWGPITFLKNTEGKLAERGGASGVADVLGWWNGIASGDVDNDGDIDFVATNFGRNIQYQATVQAPALIFYGDMDGSGKRHIVEAMFEDGVCYPWRGLSCSSHAMPFIKKRMNNSYHQFAAAPLSGIYDVNTLQQSTLVKANELRSGMFINDGNGTFQYQALDHVAQIAPAFGVTMSDFDADGDLDVYLAQNFWNPQIETAPMMGGVGQLLRNEGDGKTMTPIEPSDSGAIVRGDAKSAAVVDLNRDSLPDLVIGVNNEAPSIFINQTKPEGKQLTVKLRGKGGNVAGIGARLKLEADGAPTQTREIAAGSGFLSQSSGNAIFAHKGAGKLEVRWSDGSVETYDVPADASEFEAKQSN